MSRKGYPITWDTTVTVFNKYEDPQTNIITWHRHIITDCFWKSTGDKINIGSVVLNTDNLICRIPVQSNFLEKHLWIKKPNDEMDNYFTVSQGDIIVRDAVEEDINEYEPGKRSTDLINKYKDMQGCIQIEQIAINIGIGRCAPHYFVRGV